MTELLARIWMTFTEIPIGAWAVIGPLVAVLLTVFVNNLIARRVLEVQRGSLDIQRLTNVRSASTFIAEKRQKWIDDLRNDASKYLSLSLEISEAWKQLYWKCNIEYDEHYHHDPQGVFRACEALRIKFISENAARDSEHHQLYMRIVLRLNNDEEDHLKLMFALDTLRTYMSDLAASALKGNYSNQALLEAVRKNLDAAKECTKIILKAEWERLKREIADPDRLIRDILSSGKGQ